MIFFSYTLYSKDARTDRHLYGIELFAHWTFLAGIKVGNKEWGSTINTVE